MYTIPKYSKTMVKLNTSTEGETIEQKMERVITLKEPIKDGAPQIFTERKDGVLPEMDIRTDRFEIAVDAMDIVSKSIEAKRADKLKPKNEEGKNNDGEAESSTATETN